MKLVAFCARYGHTSADVILRWPKSRVIAFSETLGEILEEEASALKGSD